MEQIDSQQKMMGSTSAIQPASQLDERSRRHLLVPRQDGQVVQPAQVPAPVVAPHVASGRGCSTGASVPATAVIPLPQETPSEPASCAAGSKSIVRSLRLIFAGRTPFARRQRSYLLIIFAVWLLSLEFNLHLLCGPDRAVLSNVSISSAADAAFTNEEAEAEHAAEMPSLSEEGYHRLEER